MSATPIHLACPRCGYDVSGFVPIWSDACPLDGRCSECGLGFAWVDIFRPERLDTPGSFEHGRGLAPLGAVWTFLRTLWPRGLWSWLRLEAPVRPWRLALFALLVFLATWIVIGGLWARLGYSNAAYGWALPLWPWPTWVDKNWAVAAEYAVVPFGRTAAYWVPGRIAAPVAAFALWCLLTPLPFLLLPTTMARARVRRLHLLRAWVCFLPTIALVLIASALYWWSRARNSSWVYLGDPMWSYLAAPILVAWCVWWWYVFVAWYLRLERPRLTTALMLTPSLLTAVAVTAYLPRQGLIDDAGYILLRLFG